MSDQTLVSHVSGALIGIGVVLLSDFAGWKVAAAIGCFVTSIIVSIKGGSIERRYLN
jgi:hypothetical protein